MPQSRSRATGSAGSRQPALPGDEPSFVSTSISCQAGRAAPRSFGPNPVRPQERPEADVDGDLTQVLALARLFEAAFVTSRIDRQATAVQRRMGLILHDANATATGRPWRMPGHCEHGLRVALIAQVAGGGVLGWIVLLTVP